MDVREVVSQSVTDERQSLCRPTKSRFRFIRAESDFFGICIKNLFDSFTRCYQNRRSIQLSTKKLPEGPTTQDIMDIITVSPCLFNIRRQGPNNWDKRVEDIMQRGRWRKTRRHSCEGTMKKSKGTLRKIEDRAEKKNPVKYPLYQNSTVDIHMIQVEGLSNIITRMCSLCNALWNAQ